MKICSVPKRKQGLGLAANPLRLDLREEEIDSRIAGKSAGEMIGLYRGMASAMPQVAKQSGFIALAYRQRATINVMSSAWWPWLKLCTSAMIASSISSADLDP